MLDHKVLSPHTRRGQLTYQGGSLDVLTWLFFPSLFHNTFSLSLSLIFIPSLPLFPLCIFYLSPIYPLFLSFILVITCLKYLLSLPFRFSFVNTLSSFCSILWNARWPNTKAKNVTYLCNVWHHGKCDFMNYQLVQGSGPTDSYIDNIHSINKVNWNEFDFNY